MIKIIFGGSFDPIHNGHLQIAKRALEVLKADKVVFMIAKHPRWKDVKSEDNHRLEMLKIALNKLPWAEISLVEYNSSSKVNYSYESVLKYKENDKSKLFFLLGSDQLELLDKWYEIEKLSSLVQLVCICRPNYPLNQTNIVKYNVLVIEEELSSMSSTSLRNLSNLDCPKEVLDYIVENKLYFYDTLSSYMSKRRLNHTLSVASLAYDIAIENHLEGHKAYLASLLHDIGKEIDYNIQYNYVKDRYPQLVNYIPRQLYHQFMSEKIARETFKISDEEILNAIKYHATGREKMGVYEKIVYASDKIEPTRGYDSSSLIKACKEDINSGFKIVLEENIKFLKETNKSYHNQLTDQCIKYYLKGEKDESK